MAGEFIGSKSLPVKSPAGRAQAGRKSRGEQDGKRREQKIALERWEENGTGRKQQNQIGGFTPYSDQRCQWPEIWSDFILNIPFLQNPAESVFLKMPIGEILGKPTGSLFLGQGAISRCVNY